MEPVELSAVLKRFYVEARNVEESYQLGVNTPESLVKTARFYTILYFGRRGHENQRTMKPEVWFCNVPLGKHKLENLLTEMCNTAGLAHALCIRATSVTVPKAAGLENHQVKSVTGHASDKSIESYSARPTIEQQFESYAIVSQFLTKQNPDQPFLAAVPPHDQAIRLWQ
ncbi:hypothetical protein P5673_028636 [Acropora cervicornis]|uniref:Tyr recombinase domain-containing protein n=1 Tax=Acropora cervicornis TaxID=6130 RepID=A0AAD9PX10_ACRCE|nr:hypothetical protein P5673_028636 [Acropora cervicornis]